MAITASHDAPGDVSRLLKVAGAPAALQDWAHARASAGVNTDALWKECDKGDWLLWLAAVERVPLVKLVEAAAACAEAVAATMPKGRKRLKRAVAAARKLRSPEHCNKWAEACEAKADKPERANYRHAPPSAYRWAASSAAYAARSAEGLLRAEVVRATQQNAAGRARAAAIGAGDQIMDPGAQAPLVFDMDDEWVQYSFQAALKCVGHAVRAQLPVAPSSEVVEAIEAEVSEAMFAIIDPVWTALRGGSPPGELVRRIDVTLYKAVAGGDAPLITIKRPRDASFASIILPGGGHHYAEHTTTGTVLTLGVIASAMLAMMSLSAWMTPGLIMLCDALLAPAAVRRRNDGEVYPQHTQLMVGLAIIAAALVAPYVIGGMF